MTSDTQLLRAGYAETVITPPVGFAISGPEHPDRRAVDVADDLLGRVLLLEAGGKRTALVTFDVWGMSEGFSDAVAANIASSADVEPSLVWLGVSGNASSPPLWDDEAEGYAEYSAYVPQLLGGAAALAAGRMEDAELGFASAHLPDLATSVHGRAHGLNESVPIMVVDGVSGPLARVFSFSCPGSVAGPEPAEWTADYPGYACWALSEASGAQGCMFVRGPSSDVRPFDWYEGNPAPTHTGRAASDIQALGWLLATQAGIASQGALLRRNVEIKAVECDETDQGDGATKTVIIGDGVFRSFAESKTTGFGTALAEGSPDQTIFACDNLRGAPFDRA